MAKRALLVGCNYPGTEAELNGCVNDVYKMKELLLSRFGFEESNLVIMIDTDENFPQPTGANIRKGLKKIVDNTESGDVLFMHYSGHGSRVPAESGDPDDTGYDESIVPTDMNILTDNDFRDIVKALPEGVTFTFVTDCCHSGGLIDHEKEQIGDSFINDGNNDDEEEDGQATRDFQLSGQKSREYGGQDDDRRGGDYNRRGEGYGRSEREEYDRPPPRSEYGRSEREEFDRPPPRSEYGRPDREEFDRPPPRSEYGRGEEEFGRREEIGQGPPGHGRRPEFGRGEEEYGRRPEFGSEPSEYGQGGEYGGRNESHGRPQPGGYGRPEGRITKPAGRGRKIPSKNRSMSSDLLMSMIKMKFGGSAGGGGGVRTALYSVFGQDSSPMVQMFAGVLMSQAPKLLSSMGGEQGAALGSMLESFSGKEEKKQSGIGGMFSKLTGGNKEEEQQQQESQGGFGGMLSSFTGGNKSQQEESRQEQQPQQSAGGGGMAGMAMSFLQSQMGGGGGGGGGGFESLLAQATPLAQQFAQSGNTTVAHAGWKPSSEERVHEDLGIHISGCQSDETSADANPDGTASTAYGALSHSITEVLTQERGPVTYSDLVLKVRKQLKKQGFAQNPGLYCSDGNKDNYFICN